MSVPQINKQILCFIRNHQKNLKCFLSGSIGEIFECITVICALLRQTAHFYFCNKHLSAAAGNERLLMSVPQINKQSLCYIRNPVHNFILIMGLTSKIIRERSEIKGTVGLSL